GWSRPCCSVAMTCTCCCRRRASSGRATASAASRSCTSACISIANAPSGRSATASPGWRWAATGRNGRSKWSRRSAGCSAETRPTLPDHRRRSRRMPMPPIAYLVRHPSAGLLFVQLLGVLLYPWMEDTQIGRALFGAFGLLVLGMALYVVRRSPVQAWVAGVLALLVVGLTALDLLLVSRPLEALIALLEAAFYLYAAASLIAYMSADLHASTDELYAAGATFTVLAWAFAHLFSAFQLLAPGSFVALLGPEAARTW